MLTAFVGLLCFLAGVVFTGFVLSDVIPYADDSDPNDMSDRVNHG